MQQVAIVTDTIACLTRDQIERYGIRVVPPRFSIDGHEYRDFFDIGAVEAYGLLESDSASFITSAAPPGEFVEAFREASQSAQDVLCITVSSRLSALHSSAQLATEIGEKQLGRARVVVLDSMNAAAAEGLIVLAAARAAAEGKSLPEVVAIAEHVIGRTFFFVFLETIRHVYRTGRIPKIAVRAGSILNVKVTLTCSGGLIRFASVARTKERAVKRVLQGMRDQVGGKAVNVAVMHADAAEEAEALKERVSSEFECAELWISEFSPLMGYATGRGLLGLAFYVQD